MSRDGRIAVCSWSLLVRNVPELEGFADQLGIKLVHLALGDPFHASWEEDDQTFVDRIKASALQPTAAMLGFPGEDYTTPETIRRTGGFGDPARRKERLELVKWGAGKTKALGLSIMSLHAGFIPPPGDPDRGPFMDALRSALDIADSQGVTLAFETGQETAELLRQTLDELDHPRAKVNFDPANMLLYDKGDPVEAVKILGKDIVHVHAKDAKRPPKPGVWGEEVILGRGEVNFPAFLQALNEVGYAGPLAIEREVGDQKQRFEDIKTGAAYLADLL